MADCTKAQMCDAVETVLATATGIAVTQGYDEFTENIASADLPMLRVWPHHWSVRGDQSQNTFGGGVRVTDVTLYVDVYIRNRVHMGEDMKKLVEQSDAVDAVLDAQTGKHPFSLDGIEAYSWSAETVVFTWASASYTAARYTIELVVY